MTEVKRPLSLHLTTNKASPASHTSSEPPFSSVKKVALGSAPTRPTRASLTKSSSVSSTKTNCSANSVSSSTCSSGYDSPDSPSLILPYLYVGDQAQTQIDTISNLNIKYILSLQSLPKFLDTSLSGSHSTTTTTTTSSTSCSLDNKTIEVDLGDPSENIATNDAAELARASESGARLYPHKSSAAIIRKVTNGDEVEIQTELNDDNTSDRSIHAVVVEQAGTSAAHCSGAGSSGHDTIAKELLPSMNSSKDYLVKFKSCVNRLIKGKCINISDTFETLVDKFFDETHNFIEEARGNKCNILVHCKAGISRSPTIAIAYLMKWKRLHLHEAYEFVKHCRPQISPNLSFMGQLINYERQLLQKGAVSPANCTSPPMLPSPLSCCLPGPIVMDEQIIESPTTISNKSDSISWYET